MLLSFVWTWIFDSDLKLKRIYKLNIYRASVETCCVKFYNELECNCAAFWCPFSVLHDLVFIDRLKICISAADCRNSFCECFRFDDPRKITFRSLIKLNQSWMNNDLVEIIIMFFFSYSFDKMAKWCWNVAHRMFELIFCVNLNMPMLCYILNKCLYIIQPIRV